MPRKASTPKPSADSVTLTGLMSPVIYVDEARPIPDEIIEFVEHAYEFWLEHQDRWLTVELDSPDAATVAVTEARRYCTSVRDEPLTFQLRGYVEGDKTLVYRAREAVRRTRSE